MISKKENKSGINNKKKYNRKNGKKYKKLNNQKKIHNNEINDKKRLINELVVKSYDCLFCLDKIVDSELENSQLKYNKNYFKPCICNSYIHNDCLEKWYVKNKKCPICKETVIEKPKIFIENITNYGYIITIYLHIKKKILIISKKFLISLFFILLNFIIIKILFIRFI